ncbi:hypothetical protein CYMTET_16477 [Cymbomonas tetramitiformis]|uniref:Uncharacterized protein n=1 Tax=Cymbomonas tetramitiformis TaxID=36881 RepID=A0AAE0GC47_9CHLO|nr:hypothetical protein CYMTET_16477 [Cymbomonas tetramitiformis]
MSVEDSVPEAGCADPFHQEVGASEIELGPLLSTTHLEKRAADHNTMMRGSPIELPVPKGNYAKLSLLALAEEPDIGLTPAEIWKKVLESHKEYGTERVYNGIKKSIGFLKPRYATAAGVARGGTRTKLTQAGYQCAKKLRRMQTNSSGSTASASTAWTGLQGKNKDVMCFGNEEPAEKFSPSPEETEETFLSSTVPDFAANHQVTWQISDWSWDPQTLSIVPIISSISSVSGEEPAVSTDDRESEVRLDNLAASSGDQLMSTEEEVTSTWDLIADCNALPVVGEPRAESKTVKEALSTYFQRPMEAPDENITGQSFFAHGSGALQHPSGVALSQIIQEPPVSVHTNIHDTFAGMSSSDEGTSSTPLPQVDVETEGGNWLSPVRNFRFVAKLMDKTPGELNADLKPNMLSMLTALLPGSAINAKEGYVSSGCVRIVLDVEARGRCSNVSLSDVAPALLNLVNSSDPKTAKLWGEGRILLQWEDQVLALADGDMVAVGTGKSPRISSVSCCVHCSSTTQNVVLNSQGLQEDVRVRCRFNGRYLPTRGEQVSEVEGSKGLWKTVLSVSGFDGAEGVATLELESADGTLLSEPSLMLICKDMAVVKEISSLQHTELLTQRDISALIGDLGRAIQPPSTDTDILEACERFSRLLQFACDLGWAHTAGMILGRTVEYLVFMDSRGHHQGLETLVKLAAANGTAAPNGWSLLQYTSHVMKGKSMSRQEFRDVYMSQRVKKLIGILLGTPMPSSYQGPIKQISASAPAAPRIDLEQIMTSKPFWFCNGFTDTALEREYLSACYLFTSKADVVVAVACLMIMIDDYPSSQYGLCLCPTLSVIWFMLFKDISKLHYDKLLIIRQLVFSVLIYLSTENNPLLITFEAQEYLKIMLLSKVMHFVAYHQVRSFTYVSLQILSLMLQQIMTATILDWGACKSKLLVDMPLLFVESGAIFLCEGYLRKSFSSSESVSVKKIL